MYRVTRKQVVRQKAASWEGECNCSAASEARIEFEDSCDTESESSADRLQARLLINEIHQGYQWCEEHKVVFDTPSFYRSVTVAIEEIK